MALHKLGAPTKGGIDKVWRVLSVEILEPLLHSHPIGGDNVLRPRRQHNSSIMPFHPSQFDKMRFAGLMRWDSCMGQQHGAGHPRIAACGPEGKAPECD